MNPLILAFPTVIFTILLGVVLCYWLMVIIGALGVDVLDFDADGAADGALDGAADGALDGAADGALDGAADGALDGAADGALDGAADGALDGAADGAVEGASHGMAEGVAHAVGGAAAATAGLSSFLNIGKVPLTIISSFIIFWSWLFSWIGMHWLSGVFSALPVWLLGSSVLLFSLVASVFMSALCSRPLAKIFVTHQAPSQRAVLGRLCTITSSEVDKRFGLAEVADGGAGLVLSVVSEKPGLRKGDKALIIDFDPKRDTYLVESVESAIPEALREKQEALLERIEQRDRKKVN